MLSVNFLEQLHQGVEQINCNVHCLTRYNIGAHVGRQDLRRYVRYMSEQTRRIRHKAIPEGAEGLYFKVRGQDSGVVRFSFEMLETLKDAVEEQEVRAAS